jgi:hypothetical protein
MNHSSNHRGIPTLYNGIQFRSRLEAKWAAMFDLLGWKYEYEPYDLPGWIPDFLLGNTLVEIKPTTCFPADVAEEVEPLADADGREVLILGCLFPLHQAGIPATDGLVCGWLRAEPPRWRPELSRTWGRAIINHFYDPIMNKIDLEFGFGPQPPWFGLYHEYDHKMLCDPGCSPPDADRLELAVNRAGPERRGVPVESFDVTSLVDLWHQAGTRTQWRSPRSAPR